MAEECSTQAPTGEVEVAESDDPTFTEGSQALGAGYRMSSGFHRTVNGERILSVNLAKEDLSAPAERLRRQDRKSMRLNGANIGEWIGQKLAAPRIFKI